MQSLINVKDYFKYQNKMLWINQKIKIYILKKLTYNLCKCDSIQYECNNALIKYLIILLYICPLLRN
jgi:hypothetical protein